MKVDTLFLLPLLQKINPSIFHYDEVDQITQANAEGRRILVTYKNDNMDAQTSNQEELFVKQIVATHYLHKSWADLRRTLSYARTEVRFYKDFAPQFKEIFTPKCLHAEITLADVMKEDESVTDVNHDPPDQWPSDDQDQEQKRSCLQNIAGYLVLQSISSSDYVQESPLTLDQATTCLEAVAQLHGSCWENADLLKQASNQLSERGGSYHLSIRNPKEYHGLVASWNHFVSNFQHLDEELFQREEIQNVGKRIHNLTKYVSDQLSPTYTDSYATIVHGDYKAMNVFLPIHQNDKKALMIDFASAGLGFGMSDVAFHIPHAVHPNDLANGGEDLLVEAYFNALTKARKKSGNLSSYPRDVALRHYRLASIDYFRFILGRFWKSATVDTFEKRKNSQNTVLVNRNADAAFAFIRRVEGYLSEFEQELEDSKMKCKSS